MPRNRRAPAPDAAAPSDPARDLEASAPESAAPDATQSSTPKPPSSTAEQSASTAEPAGDAPAPRRRRTRAAAVPSPETPAVSAEAEQTPSPPKRRGGRRASVAAPQSDAPAEATAPVETEAPVAEDVTSSPAPSVSSKPRRGRTRKAAADAVADAPDPQPDAPAPEAAPATALPAPVRGRRRRAAAEATAPAPVNVSETEAPIAEHTDTAPAPVPSSGEGGASQAETSSARRRGGRRRKSPQGDAEAAAPNEAEAPVVGEVSADAEAPAEDDATPRGRRSRRRRRRGGDIESADDVVEGSLLPEEVVTDAPDDDDLALDVTLAAPVAVPRYTAPPLVPPALAPADGAPLPRVSARIAHPEDGRGLAQIVAGDTAHAPFFFFVNTETAVSGDVVNSQIREAAAAGIHLYSGVMYLPFKNVYGERSFGAIDALIGQTLAADPDGFLLPRLQCVPTNYWARTHPGEMARFADGSSGDVSMASAEFWADCVDALEALIAHLADPATSGGDRVIGFHLDKGEWFYDREAGYDYSAPNVTAYQNWLHAKYQQPYALRAAWFQGAATFDEAAVPTWTAPSNKPDALPVYSSRRDQPWPDYAQFASDIVAEAIVGLAAAVKTLSVGRLLVAVSYGYTMEFAARSDSGHLALGRVLQSPNVDILAGPNSYGNRTAGGAASFGAPIDSVVLHGKLWLVEDDTKTFLAEAETDDTYNPKIAGGADTQAAHQRAFGAALAHRAGVTWMDLWGQGWLDSPDIWRELGGLRDQANRLAQIAPLIPPAGKADGAGFDVVAFVDEASLAYLKSSSIGLGQTLVTKTRDLLLRTGASVGFYLQSDVLHANLPDAKVYLFMNALRVTTAERLAIREKLQRAGKTLAWVYAAGLFDEHGLSEEEIGETVGMALRIQPWNARLGSQISDARHPLLERLRGGKRTVGQDEIINPSFAVSDPQAIVLGEYSSTGAVSLAAREHPGGWKSVFFGDPYLTVEMLRGLLSYAGVGLYDTQDDVTYASGDGVLLVHASFTGQRSLTLPRPATVYDVVEDKIIATQTRSFRAFLRGRTSHLFLWGDADTVAEATGLPLPDVAVSPSSSMDNGEAEEPSSDTISAPVSDPAALADSAAANLSAAEAMSSLVTDLLSPGADTPSPQEGDESDYTETVAAALADDEPFSSEDGDDAGGAPSSAPRSRWQRRRAAMRARREAERQAQQSVASGDMAPDGTPATEPRVDMATLLPGLPPRRLPPPLRSERASPPPPDSDADAPPAPPTDE